jgi:uncharacterized protein involved in response to NO
LAAVTAREVVAGRNRRNVKVVALVLILVLALANLGFHAEVIMTGAAAYASRAGLAALVLLIPLIGRRHRGREQKCAIGLYSFVAALDATRTLHSASLASAPLVTASAARSC